MGNHLQQKTPQSHQYTSYIMPHQELGSKEDFEKAIGEQGKYVLILAYKDSVHPKAEEAAESHAGTTAAYKVDIGKQEAAGKVLASASRTSPLLLSSRMVQSSRRSRTCPP